MCLNERANALKIRIVRSVGRTATVRQRCRDGAATVRRRRGTVLARDEIISSLLPSAPVSFSLRDINKITADYKQSVLRASPSARSGTAASPCLICPLYFVNIYFEYSLIIGCLSIDYLKIYYQT